MEAITKDEQIEAMYKAIAKGLTCNGITEWQKVTLNNGREIALRFR